MDFDGTGSQKAFAAFLAQDRRTALCTKALITAWPSVTVEADECGSTPPVGLRDCDTLSMTLEDIGKELGVSKERIRQIEGKALRKLRNPGVTRLLGEPREPPYVHFVDSDAELVHSREADAPRRFGYWRRVALLIWKYCGMYQWQYADAQGVSIAASPLIYYTEASAISHGLLGRHGGP